MFLKEVFEKVNLKKVSRRQKIMKNYPACKDLLYISEALEDQMKDILLNIRISNIAQQVR